MRRFWKSESGATSVEYALVAMLIFLVIVTAVRGVSNQVGNQFNTIAQGTASAR